MLSIRDYDFYYVNSIDKFYAVLITSKKFVLRQQH